MKLIDIKNRSNIYYQVVSQSSAQVQSRVSAPVINQLQSQFDFLDLQFMSVEDQLERVRIMSQVNPIIQAQVNENN
jgi:hypothetical protein